MSTSKPTVTVMMPVFNSQDYLEEAIDSILSQTYPEFEFLILDDGSTDNSIVIARSFEDPRIHVIQNDNHRGLPFVMNQGLELARAKYVARMDADDISVPTRLAEQVRFLEDNPDIGVVGAFNRPFDVENGTSHNWVKVPTSFGSSYSTDPEFIRWMMFFRSELSNSTTMVRRQVHVNYGGYNCEFLSAGDYDMWLRLNPHIRIGNLPTVLNLKREHPGQVTQSFRGIQQQNADIIRQRAWAAFLRREVSLESVRAVARPHAATHLDDVIEGIDHLNALYHHFITMGVGQLAAQKISTFRFAKIRRLTATGAALSQDAHSRNRLTESVKNWKGSGDPRLFIARSVISMTHSRGGTRARLSCLALATKTTPLILKDFRTWILFGKIVMGMRRILISTLANRAGMLLNSIRRFRPNRGQTES